MKKLIMLWVVSVLWWALPAMGMSDQALFKHAKDAYAAKNVIALADDVSELKARQYLLAPYADYWLMLLRLEEARDEEIQNFLAQYADTPLADRVRGEWLKKLAKQQNWAPFFDEYALFKRDDTAVQCNAMLGHVQLGDADVSAQARALWLGAGAVVSELPSVCDALFDALQKTGALTEEDIWARFRLALHENKLILAKAIAARLPDADTMNFKLIDFAYQGPQAFLESKPISMKTGRKKTTSTQSASYKTRYGIEVNLYAVDRLARANVDNAAAVFERIKAPLSAENQAFAWGRIAYHAARGHHPSAVAFYALAKDVALDKEQLAWQVRAALRVQDWASVLTAINAMTKPQSEEGAWRYWKARALQAQGMVAQANAILAPLAKERHYYGWLAAEELESVMGNAPQAQYTASDNDVAAIASLPAIKRALELQALEMRWEAKAEWAWATRSFDDKQLLAAAEFAARQKWFDVAISTADNTKQWHDFALRYPTPYRDLFRAAAHNENIDEAWVYGLVRQESRFMHYAKSGVGAAGLMQLMPATAKWAAKRMGLSGYRADKIHDLSTNIEIGTYYMRYTLDLMNGQAVMATAGYNAGPGRAKKWMANTPLEAAIYIESIPFLETRLYVQKVMANAQMYAARLGLPLQTLKARLGVIPARVTPEAVISDSE